MKDFFGKISAIVVSYRPNSEFIANLQTILPQADLLIVVDNGSDKAIQEKLKAFASEHKDRVMVILNNENLGLSKAQNIGINRAFEQDTDWILLLDDDSKPDAMMVKNMSQAYLEQSNASEIVIIAPRHIDGNSNKESPFVLGKRKSIIFKRHCFENRATMFVLCAIASGSLIKSQILKDYGLMNEGFFIDYIDTEFCMRIIASDYKILAVKSALLHHHLGDKTTHNIAGKKIITSNHSPQRRYTIYRNRVITWKKYLFKVPSYIIYDILASIYDLIRITLYESQKLAKIGSALKGFASGLFTSYK